jgi:hypothetical protein
MDVQQSNQVTRFWIDLIAKISQRALAPQLELVLAGKHSAPK